MEHELYVMLQRIEAKVDLVLAEARPDLVKKEKPEEQKKKKQPEPEEEPEEEVEDEPEEEVEDESDYEDDDEEPEEEKRRLPFDIDKPKKKKVEKDPIMKKKRLFGTSK